MIVFHKSAEPFEFDESRWFENEKPSVLEAFRVLAKEGYYTAISGHDYMEREKRLKKEYEQNTKAPGSGEEQPEGKKGIIYPTTFPKADFYHKHVLNEGNPALKAAASQFNDALLDEQAKEIESLRDKCKKYADILDSVGDKLRKLKAENSRIKNSDLNLEGLTYDTRELKEKNKKIDEQNKEITRLLSLVEKKENSISRLHYEKSVLEKENEELKKGEIPAKYFDKALVDEQAEKIKKLEHEKLDILEMVSSCKQTIAELTEENERLKDQVAVLHAYKENNEEYDLKQIKRLGKEISKLNSIIHDKNAVLSDVAEELRLSKIREKNLTEVCQKYVKEVEDLREKLANKVVDKIDAQALKSAESALAYKDSYIEKLKNKKVINNRASMEAIAKYVDAVSKAELDGLVLVSWKNDGKEITSVYQLKNGKRYTLSLVYTGEEFLFYKTDLDKKRHIPTPEISEEELMKIQKKVVASYDIAEEGGDNPGVIVLCGKDFIKKLKEYEDYFFSLLGNSANVAPGFCESDNCCQMELAKTIQKNKPVK